MHDLFTQIVILTLVASFSVYLASRLGQSIIIGYILSGVLLGPFGLGVIRDPDQIRILSEIGIILLMFSVGIEFSLEKPWGLNRQVVFIGLLQIVLSVVAGTFAGLWLGLSTSQSIFLGGVVALSSTAIVLKFLSDRGELHTIHGKIGVGVLIVQDLAVIPMILLMPVLSKTGALDLTLLTHTLARATFLIGGLFAYGRWILPWVLQSIAHSRHREVLVVTTLSHCFGITWVAGWFGIPLPLGALLAGMILAFTQYAHQAVSNIIPLRDGFVGLFFISIGMLLKPELLASDWQLVGMATLGIILSKTILIVCIILAFGYPFRVAFLAGFTLAQIGEFSFLLTRVGLDLGLIGEYGYQLVIAAAIVTMLLTPLLIRLAPLISFLFERFFRMDRAARVKVKKEVRKSRLPARNHVILCGFGPIGQSLATVMECEKIPYCVMDLNPVTVRDARAKNIPIIYADAYSPEALRHMGILHAKALVITFPDPIGVSRLVGNIRRLNPELVLITRTRYDRDVARLYGLGVDFVVIEELEASLELAQLLMNSLKVKRETAERNLKFLRDRKEAIISKAILEAKEPK